VMLMLGMDPLSFSLLNDILAMNGFDLTPVITATDHDLVILAVFYGIGEKVKVSVVVQEDADEFTLHVG
jgi:hypothetical protein